MSSLIVREPRPVVNSDQYHIGLPVIAKTDDSFNGKPGTIAKIVHGQHPAFYVRLSDPSVRDLLYFSGTELQPICTNSKSVTRVAFEPDDKRGTRSSFEADTDAPTAAEAWADDAEINYHDDVPAWAEVVA